MIAGLMIYNCGSLQVLVKCNGQTQFDRWLVLTAGGPNAQLAIELLPALTALSHQAASEPLSSI